MEKAFALKFALMVLAVVRPKLPTTPQSLGFVYGLPITLGGFALKYAEIVPVEVVTNEDAEKLWEDKATETFKKVREDVTRHR